MDQHQGRYPNWQFHVLSTASFCFYHIIFIQIVNKKALVGAVSMIIQLQTSRRFVWSSKPCPGSQCRGRRAPPCPALTSSGPRDPATWSLWTRRYSTGTTVHVYPKHPSKCHRCPDRSGKNTPKLSLNCMLGFRRPFFWFFINGSKSQVQFFYQHFMFYSVFK